MMPPRDPARGVGVRRWLVLLLVASTVLGLEAATRLHQQMKFGALKTYVPRHLVDFFRFYRVNPEYRSPTVRVNRDGFRDDEEIMRNKLNDEVRIFVMGGSTVWGEDGVDSTIANEQSIAAYLQKSLRRALDAQGDSTPVRVINAGVVGYLLFQNISYFNTGITEFNPDLVVALDGHNDLDALQLGTGPFVHRNQGALDAELNAPSFGGLVSQATRYAAGKSILVRKVQARATRWISSMALGSDTWQRRMTRPITDSESNAWLARYESNILRFDGAARAIGVPVLFSVQNELAGERSKTLTADEIRLKARYTYYEWLHTTMHDRLVHRLIGVSEQRGVWFEDISDVFASERAQAYIDYTHLSGKGAEVVASRFARILLPSIRCEDRLHVIAKCRSKSDSPSDREP